MADLSINSIDAHLGTMSQTVDFLHGAHGELVANHEDMKATINNLLNTWTSNGSASYSEAQHKYNTAAENIHQILFNLKLALGGAHENYANGDNAIAKQWMV